MKDYNNCYGMPNEETMKKDKQAIQKMAEDKYPFMLSTDKGTNQYNREQLISRLAYTAAVEDMENEAVGFAEWRDNNITRAWIEKDGVKLWKVRRTDFVGEYKSTADLLTLYRESIKKGGENGL